MRIVFDTNVLFSAFITPGVCAALYEECLQYAEIIVSADILRELDRTLRSKARLTPAETREVLQALRADSTVVTPAALQERVCRDRDDDRILAAALGANADMIVTGNDDLLRLKRFKEIPILRPRECLVMITRDL